MVHTLPDNYKRNIKILRENIKRGMAPSQAVQVIRAWRSQFVAHNLYGDTEKEFINQALEVVGEKTHLDVVEI